MIELAYMSIEGISEAERELLYSCVAPDRRQQLVARKNRLSADLSLAAEALARVMLCRTVRRMEAERLAKGDRIPDDFPYSGGIPGRIQPKDFVIVRAENGKPYQGTVPGLFFNYSHSGTVVACGVAGEEIGVDIQKRRDSGRLREKVFCPEELKEESSSFFTEVWAKKESYLKLTGEGLRKELKSLNVYRMQAEAQVQWYSEWVTDEYCLCACLEGRETYGSEGLLSENEDNGAAKGRVFRSCPVRPEEITEYIREVQEG